MQPQSIKSTYQSCFTTYLLFSLLQRQHICRPHAAHSLYVMQPYATFLKVSFVVIDDLASTEPTILIAGTLLLADLTACHCATRVSAMQGTLHKDMKCAFHTLNSV